MKTGSSESQAEAEELNQSQSVGTCIVIGLSFSASASNSDNLLKRNVSDGVVSGVRRKWKRSYSSDSDYVALMAPLTTIRFLISPGHKRSYDLLWSFEAWSNTSNGKAYFHQHCYILFQSPFSIPVTDSYPVAIYVFWGWEKIGGYVEARAGSNGKGRRKLFFLRPFPWDYACASTYPPIFSHPQNT